MNNFAHRPYRLAFLASLALASATPFSNLSAQTFAPNSLVVSAYGTPTSSGLIDGQSVPISLQDFSLTTATLPTFVSSTTLNGIVGEYGSSSEGNIQLTGTGQDLTIAGYSASQAAMGIGSNTNGDNGNGTYNVGTPYGGTAASGGTYSSASATPLAQSSPADVARVADVIDGNGDVVSNTSFSNIYNTNNSRSAYSPTGSSIYISGQGDKTTSQQGIFYSPTTGASYSGSSTATGIYNANDTRFVTGYNSGTGTNLYYSLDKKSTTGTGIFKFSGLPTGSATATQITTFTSVVGGTTLYNSPEAFFFANPTTLYVADTGAPKAYTTSNNDPGNGGIQKWSDASGTWQLQYVLKPSNFVSDSATTGETGFEAITAQVVGGTVDLYAVSYTASDDNPNGLYAIADSLSATTAPGNSFTEVAAPGNGAENFKGVAFDGTALSVPEPGAGPLAILAAAIFLTVRRRRLKAGPILE